MFSRHGPRVPSGWVPAPDSVKEEILLVWQEDEMPEELKNAPGYVPFTLSPDAEGWLSGMAEIKELQDAGQTVIIGRPRPAAPRERRSLIPAPAAAPAPSADAPTGPLPVPSPAPDLSAKEWVRRQAPRNVPVIADRDVAEPPPPAEPAREGARSLPDIGGEAPTTAREEPPRGTVRAVPQIGGEEGSPPEPAPAREQSVKPRSVPQIGPAEDAD